MNWKKFDEISQEQYFLYTEPETGCKIYDEAAIEEAQDVWEDETVTLTNFELQEIIERHENEVRKEKERVMDSLREEIKLLKQRIQNAVNALQNN